MTPQPNAVPPIPEGSPTVMPWIILRDTARLLDFMKGAFGAQELVCLYNKDGTIAHAKGKIGNSIVGVFDTREGWPNTPYLTAMRAIRRLMHGDHPFMGAHDFAVIEDTHKEGNPVVACTCLWKHTWTYEGIPFRVGRPEMVATDPAYRHRGLVRALFELVHERSEAEGDLVQVITGISYFYRQFGYEYALELEDRRTIPLALIPKAKESASELFTLHEASVSDIPEIAAFYNRRRASSLVSESITHNQWFYEIEGWKAHPHPGHSLQLQIIVDAGGQMVGFVALDTRRRGKELSVWLMEFAEGWKAFRKKLLAASASRVGLKKNSSVLPSESIAR